MLLDCDVARDAGDHTFELAEAPECTLEFKDRFSLLLVHHLLQQHRPTPDLQQYEVIQAADNLELNRGHR